MKHILLSLLLIGCSTYKQGASIKPWTQPVYQVCSPNVIATSLPFEIGFTLYNTNLPTRYDSFSSMRPYTVSKAGTAQNIGESVVERVFETGVHFNYFTADGKARITRHWKDPEHAMWEEAAKRNLPSETANKATVFEVDLQTLIATEIVVPKSPYLYGIWSSPDNTRAVYTDAYKLVIVDKLAATEKRVDTGCVFNFLPTWSPDSQHLVFFCGATNIAPSIYLIDRDGNNLQFLADRGGYSGSIPIIDGFDYHNGGSDFVTWIGNNVVYAAAEGSGTELFEINISSKTKRQLTFTSGTLNYYPTLSPDGNFLLFNSNYNSRRNINYLDLNNLEVKQITNVDAGCGVYTIKWSPL